MEDAGEQTPPPAGPPSLHAPQFTITYGRSVDVTGSRKNFSKLTESNASLSPILPINIRNEPLAIQAPRHGIKVTLHNILYTFLITNFEKFEIFPAPMPATVSSPSLSYVHPNAPYGRTTPEAETIASFFRLFVAAPPYRLAALVSFIRIIALPLPPSRVCRVDEHVTATRESRP